VSRIEGQSDIAYHADPAIGSTTAKLHLESPQLLKDELDGIRVRKDSRAFQFGRAAHAKFTDPALFLSLACTGPINEKTGKPYGAETKAYTEWADANPGKIILGQRDLADLHLMDSRMPSQVREILSDPDRSGDPPVKLRVLAGFCPYTLRPLSQGDVLRRAVRREQIRERMAAKAAESELPEDERRGRSAVAELIDAGRECALAMVVAAPVSLGCLFWLAA
jgi:hypothetical protein